MKLLWGWKTLWSLAVSGAMGILAYFISKFVVTKIRKRKALKQLQK